MGFRRVLPMGRQRTIAAGNLQLGGSLVGVLDLNKELARVDALVEIDKTLLSNLEATGKDVLGLLELALLDPARELATGLDEQLGVVEDDKTLHLDAHGDDTANVTGADGLVGVVLANHAAHDEAGVLLGLLEGKLESLATNVVKVDVNEALGGLGELASVVGVLVVEGSVKTELINEPLGLVVGAADTNDTGTLELGNLSGNTAGSTSGARNNNELTRLGVANLGHAVPGSQASHAEGREDVLGVLETRVCVGRGELAVAEDGVLGPAEIRVDVVANLGLFGLGGEDAASRGAAHDFANGDGGNVRADI